MAAEGSDGFDEFYGAVYHRLVRQLFAVVGDVGEAEDVVQEAFVRAAIHWRRVGAYDHPEAWVRRVALNRARNNLRRHRRALAAVLRLGPPPDVPALSPDGLAVDAVLRRLPRRHREVLVLHYIAQVPVEQIAQQLSIPVGTVKSRLARGRTALARQLEDEELRHA